MYYLTNSVCLKIYLISFPAAVNNVLLLNERWMLGGATTNPSAKNLHAWHPMLQVDKDKQLVFIQRVLLLHEIASKKGGRGIRLSLNGWNLECDRCCLMLHILDAMSHETDELGNKLFEDDLLSKLVTRVIEGPLGANLYCMCAAS